MRDTEPTPLAKAVALLIAACIMLLVAGIPLAALIALVKFLMWLIGA